MNVRNRTVAALAPCAPRPSRPSRIAQRRRPKSKGRSSLSSLFAPVDAGVSEAESHGQRAARVLGLCPRPRLIPVGTVELVHPPSRSHGARLWRAPHPSPPLPSPSLSLSHRPPAPSRPLPPALPAQSLCRHDLPSAMRGARSPARVQYGESSTAGRPADPESRAGRVRFQVARECLNHPSPSAPAL
ncbi:hypothetical protein B0H15DRAFT_958665 [Mycena belliarum]|uniref:Uncharacterized protein n=1 Tax=Mycena belliarum TaxID=1033014 RepID=A0AAD6XHC1_9AGAR|nr:hypothetical protein B0H15DRAFT_958665 [Mycena belliae]